jgi:uncharacterized protein
VPYCTKRLQQNKDMVHHRGINYLLGIFMSQLGDALFTKTQQAILKLLYTHPEKSFYTKEILRLTGMGVATIKRELDRMERASVLKKFKIGNQLHYQANTDCPIYSELITIADKTFGLNDTMKLALEPLAHKIVWAFIFGSIASEKETPWSDIDLMIIGTLDFFAVAIAVNNAQHLLGREINPKIYTPQEWKNLLKEKTGFIKSVLQKPKINIIGDGHEFK